jgi:hypothetical protein
MIEKLLEQIKAVSQARDIVAKAKSDYEQAFNEWQESNQQLIEFRQRAVEVQNEAEVKLRELTIQAYQETGDKKPAPGVGIREITKLNYDSDQAFKWALEHKIALTLDRKNFEQIAKSSPPDFVEVSMDIQATIATDLSKTI